MGMFGNLFAWNVYAPKLREKLYPGEENYFRQNPEVAGMAAQDNRVILNPYSTLPQSGRDAVYKNEAARIFMRQRGVPPFDLTPQQQEFLNANTYKDATPDERRATIMGRVLSGDPSAGQVTPQQMEAARRLRKSLGWR